MSYQYSNQFRLSDELATAISYIISKKEGKEYICKSVVIKTSEHKGLVFWSPLDNYCLSGGGFVYVGAQISKINEKHGKYEEKDIPEEGYNYLVIMDKESFTTLAKFSFKSEDEIERTLNVLSALSVEYDGIFDSTVLCQKFPYLKEFFDKLDEWRAEANRVTLDSDVIAGSMKKTLARKVPVSKR